MKMKLALPRNIAENQDFLANALSTPFWIAVTEGPEDGSWIDDEGQNVTFTNWAPGFPPPDTPCSLGLLEGSWSL